MPGQQENDYQCENKNKRKDKSLTWALLRVSLVLAALGLVALGVGGTLNSGRVL